MCKVIKSLTEIKYERRSARVAPTLQVGGGGRGGAAKIGEPGRSCPTVSGTGDAPGWVMQVKLVMMKAARMMKSAHT